MINNKNPKAKEIIEYIHKAVKRKTQRVDSVSDTIVRENRLLSCICNDFEAEPREYARLMNEKYGYNMAGTDVIKTLRKMRMGHVGERKELLKWADELTDRFEAAVKGNRTAYETFEKMRNSPIPNASKKHDDQDRVATIMIFEKHPELDVFDDYKNIQNMGRTLIRYIFFDMADAISDVYGFPAYKDRQKPKEDVKDNKPKMTLEQAMRRIERLESSLERSDAMLQELQDEFAEQLEASRVQELTDFFAKLNSEKYGCILDELLGIRKGVNDLKKKNFEPPIELNGILIMAKKLIQFVRDSHINPIMKTDSVQEVTASDVEFCNYDGTPFTSPADKKTIRVISPGWVYKDKDIQISRPTVKEEIR